MTNYLKIWGPFEPSPNLADTMVKLGVELKFYFFALHVDQGMRHISLTFHVKEQKFTAHVEKSNAGSRRFKSGPVVDTAAWVGDYAEPIPGLLTSVLADMLPERQKAKLMRKMIRTRGQE